MYKRNDTWTGCVEECPSHLYPHNKVCNECPAGKKVYREDEMQVYCYDSYPPGTFMKDGDNVRCYANICPGLLYSKNGNCYDCLPG